MDVHQHLPRDSQPCCRADERRPSGCQPYAEGRRRESGRARRLRRVWPRRRRRRSFRKTASPPRRAPRRVPSPRRGRLRGRPGRSCGSESAGGSRAAARRAAGRPGRRSRLRAGCRRRRRSRPTLRSALASRQSPRRAPAPLRRSATRATVSRGPTRMRTSLAPVRSASQRAAMRVPLPDSSAVRAVRVPDHDLGFVVRRRHDLDDAVGIPHLGPYALRRQSGLVSEQVDVPVRVPLRESHPRPRPRASPPRP